MTAPKTGPKVGQTVYLKITKGMQGEGNIVKGTLKSIGRKYYTVSISEFSEYQFDKNDLTQKTEYSQCAYLYFDEQGIYDDQEKKELISEFRKRFEYGNPRLSLDHLRRIKAILDEAQSIK